MRAAAVTVLLVLICSSVAQAAPRVRGKTVAQWLDVLTDGNGDTRMARSALIEAGPDAAAAVGKRLREIYWIEHLTHVLATYGDAGLEAAIAAVADPSTKQRQELIEWIASRGATARAAVPMLLAASRDEEQGVRAAAALALADVARAKVAGPRLQELTRDPDRRVAAAAIRAYAALDNDPDRLRWLTRFLGHKSEEVRVEAVRAFGLQGPAAARWALHRVLAMAKDESKDVRGSVLRAAVRMAPKSQAVAKLLAEALESEKGDVRKAAAIAARDLAKTTNAVTKQLDRAMRDTDRSLRRSAAISLAAHAAGVERLLGGLLDTDAGVRATAASGLSHVAEPTPGIFEALIRLLRDADYDVLFSTELTLETLGPGAIPLLIAELTKGDEKYKSRIENLVGEFGPAASAAVPQLLENLKKTRFPDQTIEVLEQVATPERVPSIEPLLAHEHERLRRTAIRFIAAAGPLSAPMQAKFFDVLDKDIDKRVRATAARALATVGEPIAADLVARLSDDHPEVDDAVALLGRNALAALKKAQKIPPVVRATARVLGPDAAPYLRGLLKDKASWNVKAALEELEKLGPAAKPVMPALLPFLKSFGGTEAVGALRVLKSIGPESVAHLNYIKRFLKDGTQEQVMLALEIVRDIGPPAKSALPLLKKLTESVFETQRNAAAAAIRSIESK